MIQGVDLVNIKSFAQEKLTLGPVSLLIGGNASGKSNIIAALRWLAAISHNPATAADRSLLHRQALSGDITLHWSGFDQQAGRFQVHLQQHLGQVSVSRSILDGAGEVHSTLDATDKIGLAGFDLSGARFIDFDGDSLRLPGRVGQTELGDRGEGLGPILAQLCLDRRRQETLESWLQALIPGVRGLEVEHADWPSVLLREQSGHTSSLASASAGTLRVLGLLALLCSPQPPPLLCIEQLEQAIHPSGFGLLLSLLEARAQRTGTQILATTHASSLLNAASPPLLAASSLVYRAASSGSTIVCFADLLADFPKARHLITEHGPGHLHTIGWFETMMDLRQDVGK
jgi:hypothetical protein